MNVTQLLRVVRGRLSDSPNLTSQRTWSDRELLDTAHTIQCSMFRDRVDAQEASHNVRVQLPASLAIQRHAGTFEYRLPSWAYSMTKLRETKGTTEADAAPVPAVVEDLSGLLPSNRWRYAGSNVLWFYGSSAINLTCDVAKRPARPIKGTVDVAGSTTLLNLVDDASVTDVEHELEVDSYRGEQIMITGRASGTGSLAIVGQARVVESSARVDTGAGVWRQQLSFHASDPFGAAIAIGHTYETLLGIDEAHTQFFVLRILEECAYKTDNVAAIEVIKSQLRYEWAKWETHLRTRDRSGPKHFGGETDWFERRDPDRDPYFTVS